MYRWVYGRRLKGGGGLTKSSPNSVSDIPRILRPSSRDMFRLSGILVGLSASSRTPHGVVLSVVSGRDMVQARILSGKKI